MKIDGGCLCRHITYEPVVDPAKVAICHCTDCQTHSGTTFGVVVGITDGQFHLRSGTRRALAFCPECGTRIHARTVGEGSSFFGLRLGTVNQRDQLTPKRQVWSRSAQGWLAGLESIPKFEKQPKM